MRCKHTIYPLIIGIAFLFAVAQPARAQQEEEKFTYRVEQNRLIGHRDGELVISESKVEYRTKNVNDSRVWSYTDIRLLELLSPTRIRIHTYEDQKRLVSRDGFRGRDESFDFKILDGQLDQRVSDFLRARISRPFVTAFTGEGGEPLAQIAVKHLQRFGGDQGTLKVYQDRLVYEAKDGRNTRSWRWTDIKSVGRSDTYRFEVLTYEPQFGGPERSFNFLLKEPMQNDVYDLIWNRVFRPTPLIRPGERAVRM